MSLFPGAVTSLNDLNLTLRQRIGSKDTRARFARSQYGEADSVLCSAELQTAEEAVAALGTAGQDH